MRNETIQQIARIRHGTGYLEDAHREYDALCESLMESIELTGDTQISATEMVLLKRAKGSLLSAIRFLEAFEKAGGLTDA